MSIIKKPYEISLWEEVLIFRVTRMRNGEVTEIDEYEEKLPQDIILDVDSGDYISQYYKERKICVIGSNTMDTPIRATQPKLVTKVNGENILTFNMYSHYYDENSEQYYKNPYIGYLINERKIKLRYGSAEDPKWYDFIIKNVEQNSETKTYSYTAKDLYINELSKSGFNLEFNQELENNIGNINTLGGRVLEGSDWRLKDSGDILKQTLEEPLYFGYINDELEVTLRSMEDENIRVVVGGKNSNDLAYISYDSVVNKQTYFQLFFVENGEFLTDKDNIISNSPNYYLDGVNHEKGEPYYNGKPLFKAPLTISDTVRGRRLVRKVRTDYDAAIDKYVNIYEGNIYGFTETKYISPVSVRSYVTNSTAYDSELGWEIGGTIKGTSTKYPEFDLVSVPDPRDLSYDDFENWNLVSCLKFSSSTVGQTLYNSGIVDYRQHINGFVKGEPYVFSIKYGEAKEIVSGTSRAKTLKGASIPLKFTICKYHMDSGTYIVDDKYFEGAIVPSSNDGNGKPKNYHITVSCLKSLSYEEMVQMTNSLGLLIIPQKVGTIYIENVQFFPYVDSEDEEHSPLFPGKTTESKVKTIYYYYDPKQEGGYDSIEQIKFLYKGDIPCAEYKESYNDIQYEKIRSITASESNRFNLIQDLCEIFECWPKFEIEHKSTGEIILDEEDGFRQKKWVSFHDYIGTPNPIGFKYGINLKNIQRTLESDGIVTKLVVKNNSNEFATDGFCSIARATESTSGENFILDFGYYIQQDLIGLSELTNDLYLEGNGWIGYYKQLKRINKERDKDIITLSGLLADITEYQASYQTYSISASEAEKQYRDKEVFIKTLTGYTFKELMDAKDSSDKSKAKAKEWWGNDQVVQTVAALGRLKACKTNYTTLSKTAETNLANAQAEYDALNTKLTDKEDLNSSLYQKEQLHAAFYKKYSRFLQEGSWISEDYIDDNLYYLDAQSTLYTSSRPKVSYNISVLELSQLEGYENFTFALGDETTIEDTEFFGWTTNYSTGIKTPYKEQIVVTELTIMLDQPEQNQIKVQNYKNQFEDLFQRMAATTQSVEYSTGQYQKVAGIVETDGTIDIVTLQNSIANNAVTLQNAKDQTVIWDETGITTMSASRPAEIVRIVSGGIFLSIDGGITWNTGITGSGINASYITTGQLNIERVNILNGAFPAFRWDSAGISAYSFTQNPETKEVINFDYSKFIRMDQYGLYGINGISDFDTAVKDTNGLIGEEKIKKYSNFSLTWSGFQIKSDNHEGYISITSDNDFQVLSKEGNEEYVKIGWLNRESIENGQGTQSVYGLRLTSWSTRNGQRIGQVVLEQANNGEVWIRNELKVGHGTSTVALGYLDKTKYDTDSQFEDLKYNQSQEELKEIHQVINAANKFIVHEDGSMVASNGTFTGTIHATGGTIGGIKISEIVNEYQVVIESESGIVFKDNEESKKLTAKLYRGTTEITQGLTYQWYIYNEELTNETEKTLIINAADLKEYGDQAIYYCEISIEED